ncbi:MAG TPA: FecR domain-containing protein [Polyangiaceae bacterium]|nr:FecR domain-containing protein [Polyangiaceae bacterium]
MADEREPLSERQVSNVVRLLTEEHAAARVERDAQRAWARIEGSVPPTLAEMRPASSGMGRVVAIAGVVALAAAGILALGFKADSQLSYELRGGHAQGGVIEAERGEATVALSDGSSILAENRTKFSVDVVGRNAALTRLVAGKLHVRVVHNDDTSYRFIAGPYEVRVVGTEFDLAWEPNGAGLSLAMSKGEVRLVEPGGKLRTLKSGEALRLPGLAQAVAQNSVPAAAQPAAAAAAPVEVEAATAPRAHEAPSAPSWDALVAKGQFADVVREAETLGLDSVTDRRGPSDLKALGQAARYVGKRALSLRAFTALRERNRGTDYARQAAFFLARLQEEQGNQAEALRWLGTYVTEAPKGVYAAEAYGRRLSLTERLRGPAAAVPLAREYLERFPQGAYAQSARALVEHR